MELNKEIVAADLKPAVQRLFELASDKVILLNRRWKTGDGAPVFTVKGKYTARSWTQWTQGFQYGNALLCYEVTGRQELLDAGRKPTLTQMAAHLTHTGVHDHGFNNISTYGQLRRMMIEGSIPFDEWELHFYELALKVSGAVQAGRWTALPDSNGYIYSFNGSHSLFIDTLRTIRVCGVAHTLGHRLLEEQDASVNLLGRLLVHARTSAKFNVYYGEGRDSYDLPQLRGRTVHEAIFNPASGAYRCPSSQQGYSPFSTWTRGLAWAMLGFAEELEFIRSLDDGEFSSGETISKAEAVAMLTRAARATSDFYISQASAADGICYWDTGAPRLHLLGDWQKVPANPFNRHEPVDSSASVIAAQGLIRLGRALGEEGLNYTRAGMLVASRLLDEPYLSSDPAHEGLLLHSVYHRPNGWDYIPDRGRVPYGESSMWGDYHMLELGLLLWRLADQKYYTFFDDGGGAYRTKQKSGV